MKLNKEQTQLLEFVKMRHGTQVRKYTNEPYWTHPYAVAEIIHEIYPGGIEIALCHDLIEDTDCTFPELYSTLHEIGYRPIINYIIFNVSELTDKFTKKAYPNSNREERKYLECERLSKISYACQTIKYADLLHNSKSILQYDPSFAKVYLREKKDLLEVMRIGNLELFYQCCKVVFDNTKIKNPAVLD